MIIVTLQRGKCIGCGYCAEVGGEYFWMNPADGKCELIGTVEKKGFYTLRTGDTLSYGPCLEAKNGCPVRAIEVKRTE